MQVAARAENPLGRIVTQGFEAPSATGAARHGQAPLRGAARWGYLCGHAFQKKSTKGTATPKPEADPIRRRLADAERLHRERRP